MRFPTGTIGWFDFILFALKYIEITLVLAFWPDTFENWYDWSEQL